MSRTLLPALALAVLLAPLAAAAVEDVEWRMEARSVAMAAAGNGFTYSSSRDSALGDDLLSGSFQAVDGQPPLLESRLTASQPDEADVQLRVRWQELVEYRDADGDGRFGLADPVVQRIALADLPASTVVAPVLGGQSATTTLTLPDNESGSGPLPVPGDRGSLRLTFLLVSSPANVAGHALGPTELGVAVEVRRFPFAEDGSRLALVSEVATARTRLDHEADGVVASLGALTFGLRWDDATADGVAVPSPASVVSSSGDQVQLVQSLPRGDRVEQRGSVTAQRWADGGAVLEALPPGDWRFYALGVAAVAVGLGVPSARRMRKRDQEP